MSVCLWPSLLNPVKHMRRITLSSAGCLAVPYFSTLPHKRHDCQKKSLNIKCAVFSLHLSSETFMILEVNEPEIKNMHLSLHVKYSLFCRILMIPEFYTTDFRTPEHKIS